MSKVTCDETDKEKLSQNGTGVSFGSEASIDAGITKTKKGSKQFAKPYIKARKVKGHTYYYYCHGKEREMYLGTADAILKAVKGDRHATKA